MLSLFLKKTLTLNFHFNHISVKPNILYLLSYQPTYYCMLIYKLITSTIFKFEITFFFGLSELIYFNTKSSKTLRRKYFAYQK